MHVIHMKKTKFNIKANLYEQLKLHDESRSVLLQMDHIKMCHKNITSFLYLYNRNNAKQNAKSSVGVNKQKKD